MIEKDFVINNFLDRIEKLEGRMWEVEKTAWTGSSGYTDDATNDEETMLNIMDFGAVGNGVTDDTAAFEAVVAALKTNSGGKVYIPMGTYLCTRPIVWPYHYGAITIEGDGAKSLIYYTPTDRTDCWKIPQWINKTEGNTTARLDMRVIIRDLAIKGAGKTETGTGNGLTIFNTLSVTIESLTISNFGGGAGINNQGGQNVGIYRSFLVENKYGIHLRDSYPYDFDIDYYGLNSNNVGIRDCHIQHNASHGVYISLPSGGSRAIQTVLDNDIIQGNGDSAVYADDFSFLRINNCYFETNQTANATGDLHFEKGYYLDIDHCEDHWSGSSVAIVANDVSRARYGANALFGSITLDSNCAYWQFENIPSGATIGGSYHKYIWEQIDSAFTDTDTTPSVLDNQYFYCSNTSATSITDFDDGKMGQKIMIYFTTANTTLVSSGNIRLTGADNWNPPANAMIELMYFGAYNWVETGRMDPT